MAYVLLLAIVALGVPLALNLKARVNAEVRTQAQGQADLVAATAADLLGRPRRRELDTLVRTAAGSVRGRILVVNASGGVVVDSSGPSQLGASYESRPEINAALAGRQVQVQRASKTLGQEILATAVPVIRNGRPVGAVRVTQSVAAVRHAVGSVELQLALLAAIVLALGLAAGAVIAEQVSHPLRRLERIARRVAAGDLSARAAVEGSTEQRSLGQSFNEMTDRIERLLQAQQDFVADASHQLRTPLTGLRLRLEEASANGAGDGSAMPLHAAMGEVDRLSRMVDELLVLSRGGARQVARTSVDLAELADAVVARWRSAADAKEIALTHRSADGPATAWAGRVDLERALDALVENAIRYAPRGSEVTLVSGPGALAVLDRGPGLAPGELDDVFKRFHRGTAGHGEPGGSGLGLAIARELSREWGGEVRVQNRDGGGAVATISLPAGEA